MRSDLHPFSDVGQCVFFDPVAVPELIHHDAPIPLHDDWLEDYARRGEVLEFRRDVSEICDELELSIHTRLFIDEDVDPRLLEVSRPTLKGAILNVPSGQLFGIGAEGLATDVKDHESPSTYHPSQRSAEPCIRLTKGHYLIDAYQLS